MIRIIKASSEHHNQVIALRYEMLKDVNNLLIDNFSNDFRTATEAFFTEGNQTTFLAMDDNVPVGCATICYIMLMPTYSHPIGKRAHIMNVYTRKTYRRQGIAKRLMEELLKEAKEKVITHISLDATEEGRLLYEKLGFKAADEGMELTMRLI